MPDEVETDHAALAKTWDELAVLYRRADEQEEAAQARLHAHWHRQQLRKKR